jgi:hypothetical protein
VHIVPPRAKDSLKNINVSIRYACARFGMDFVMRRWPPGRSRLAWLKEGELAGK